MTRSTGWAGPPPVAADRPTRTHDADRDEDVGVQALLTGRDREGAVGAAGHFVEVEATEAHELVVGELLAEVAEDRWLAVVIRAHHVRRFDRYGRGHDLEHLGDGESAGLEIEEHAAGEGIGARRDGVVAVGDEHLRAMTSLTECGQDPGVDQACLEHGTSFSTHTGVAAAPAASRGPGQRDAAMGRPREERQMHGAGRLRQLTNRCPPRACEPPWRGWVASA